LFGVCDIRAGVKRRVSPSSFLYPCGVLVGSTGAEQLIKAVINSSTAQILQLLLELQHWSWSWS